MSAVGTGTVGMKMQLSFHWSLQIEKFSIQPVISEVTSKFSSLLWHWRELVLLRPPNFHCHRGGWLPPNQHRHRGVLLYSRRSFWVLFSQKSQNCPSRPQSRESSKCHVIWSRHLILRERSRGAVARVGFGDIARCPPHGIRFPTSKWQDCWYSRDSLGTVLSETVATVSLSAPPTVPCSEQLAHSRTAGNNVTSTCFNCFG